MVSTRPLISKSFSPCTDPLVTVPSMLIAIGITVIFMFYSFLFSSLASSRYLSVFSLSFSFTLWSARMTKSTIWQVLFFLFFFFLLTITMSGHQAEIRWSVWISKSKRILCILLFCPVSWGCRIHRLLLCRRVRLLLWVSWIWHKTIWWWGSSNAGALGNAEYPFIAITLRFTLTLSGSTW